ncbi:acetyl/propionyl/methylcrotonyl-CoA carboxylase subunit alpha [Advenella sp. FME57]|uniref:acetyl-CoA carboxylase biotin carboxylase subunit n=1 Tax=Advenella sp. FME57 TaxID=2742604 RepID=UPI001866C52F|nr:biotin carboxylase N-terminal domain-containing protein [Advenella sp. FME57]
MSEQHLRKVLVANRAAVAQRVIRALRELGIKSVAVYSEADRDLPYWKDADEAHLIGPAAAQESYLNTKAILDVAKRSGADAIHPGYGFLSENADFAEQVQAEGMIFIGPSPKFIRELGHKSQARALMSRHGMPMARSSGVLPSLEAALVAIKDIGYPVLLKPAGGGGGIGMIPIRREQDVEKSWQQASTLAQRFFSQADLFVEQLIETPRHIEFQFLADRYGNARCIFERDCSTQRRHQKVIEEAPAPALARSTIDAMASRLETILSTLQYDVIGTVEMLYTPQSGFVFLEVNTRLQVEHAVTEAVTGIDLVHAQIRLAAGARLKDVLPEQAVLKGHAIEARVYAEDPIRFFPSPGLLTVFEPPVHTQVRVETGYRSGTRVSSHYDPMLAKVIAWGNDRDAAIDNLIAALEDFRIEGVKHNIPFIQNVLSHHGFRRGQVSTDMLRQIQQTTITS